jgi:hypothetical protein
LLLPLMVVWRMAIQRLLALLRQSVIDPRGIAAVTTDPSAGLKASLAMEQTALIRFLPTRFAAFDLLFGHQRLSSSETFCSVDVRASIAVITLGAPMPGASPGRSARRFRREQRGGLAVTCGVPLKVEMRASSRARSAPSS